MNKMPCSITDGYDAEPSPEPDEDALYEEWRQHEIDAAFSKSVTDGLVDWIRDMAKVVKVQAE